jgi:hypothetical protein
MQNVSPLHQAAAILHDIDQRSRRAGRGSAMMRASLDGAPIGRSRVRSVVEEDDRLVFYGLRFFLLDGMVSETTPLRSRGGVAYGVRMTTDSGTVEIQCPPGLRHRQ